MLSPLAAFAISRTIYLLTHSRTPRSSTTMVFLGFLLTAYIGVPVLGVALLSIVIGIEYTGIMKPNTENLAIEGDDDDF